MAKLAKASLMLKRIAINYKYKHSKRDKNCWAFGEWFGDRCNDNSFYLANYVAKNEPEISIYWIAKKNCSGTELLDPRIKVVEMDSAEAKQILSRAGAAFVNEGVQDLSGDFLNYSSGAVIVNLWHGVPWKKIGMDSYSGVAGKLYSKLVLSLQSYSYVVTSSEVCSNALKSAFLIKDSDKLIRSGLPRNSLFYDPKETAACRKQLISFLDDRYGGIDDETKIITYMPTFRDRNEKIVDLKSTDISRQLNDCLRMHNAVLLQKAHYVSQKRDSREKLKDDLDRILYLDEYASQELLAASDILITDYSSCFFDFLILDRPIIHFLYDYDYYANKDRGLYYTCEEPACGDIAANVDQLRDSIVENLENPDKNRALRDRMRKKHIIYDSKDCCRIITDVVRAAAGLR